LSEAYVQDKVCEISPRTRERLQNGCDENGTPYRPRTGQRPYLFDDDGNRVKSADRAVEMLYGQSADQKIRLPAGGMGGITWGLDIVAIYRWWEVFRRAPMPVYKLLGNTQNCAGVAALALRAGLANSYVKPPRALFFMDPNQIARWAGEVDKVIETLNTYSSDALRIPAVTGFAPIKATELMSLKDWKYWTAKNVSAFAIRGGQVAKIDQLLEQYHAITWNVDPTKSYPAKIELLKQLMTQVHSYLGEKAGGKRQDAVLLLGEQITAVIKHRFGSPAWAKAVDWDVMFN
jgi:hypothetical protein